MSAIAVVLGMLVALSARPAWAGGGAEHPASAERTVFLLYPRAAEVDPLVRERFDLSASAAAFFWSRYTMDSGRVEIERGGLYAAPRPIGREELGPWVIYTYRFSIPEAAEAAPATPLPGWGRREIEFAAAEVLSSGLQPATLAVERAIREARRQAGSVRLASLVRVRGDRFRARVELR